MRRRRTANRTEIDSTERLSLDPVAESAALPDREDPLEQEFFAEEPYWQEFDNAPTSRPASDEEPRSRRLWAWAIFLTAVAIGARAVWFIRFQDNFFFRLGPDGETYITQAQSYLRGAIADPDQSTLARVVQEVFPPGYPLFLTGIFRAFPEHEVFAQSEHVLITVRVIQWLLAGATTLMTFALARRVLFGFTALIPPALLSLSIAMVDTPSMFMYETPLAFLLVAAVLLLVKAKEGRDRHSRLGIRDETAEKATGKSADGATGKAANEVSGKATGTGRNVRLQVALAGLALSYAILVQPRAIVILPFLAIWARRGLGSRIAVTVTLIALLLPTAWIGRNYAVFGELVPISINGQASVYLDNLDPIGGVGFVQSAAPPECPRAQLLSNDDAERFAWSRCMQRAGINQIAEHPLTSAAAVPDRLAALISTWSPQHARGTYSVASWDYRRLVPAKTRDGATFKSVDEIAAIAWFALYTALLLAGIWSLLAERPGSVARLLAVPIVSLPLIHLVFHAENRFRLPILPFFVIAIALGFLNFVESRGRRDRLNSVL